MLDIMTPCDREQEAAHEVKEVVEGWVRPGQSHVADRYRLKPFLRLLQATGAHRPFLADHWKEMVDAEHARAQLETRSFRTENALDRFVSRVLDLAAQNHEIRREDYEAWIEKRRTYLS